MCPPYPVAHCAPAGWPPPASNCSKDAHQKTNVRTAHAHSRPAKISRCQPALFLASSLLWCLHLPSPALSLALNVQQKAICPWVSFALSATVRSILNATQCHPAVLQSCLQLALRVVLNAQHVRPCITLSARQVTPAETKNAYLRNPIESSACSASSHTPAHTCLPIKNSKPL